MATITKTETKTTDWKFPTVAKQDGTYSASDALHSFRFNGSTPILCRNNGGNDLVELYTPISSNTYGTHTIYCSGFNFKNEIPNNANINKIYIRIVDRVNVTSGKANCYFKLVRSGGTSSGGFGNLFNRTVSGTTINDSYEFVKEANPNESTIGPWAEITIGTDIVNNDNFGICFYYKGSNSTKVNVNVFYVLMKIEYSYTYTVEVNPTYDVSYNPNKEIDYNWTNDNIEILLTNTNNVSANVSATATISDLSVCRFLDTANKDSTISGFIGASESRKFSWELAPMKKGSTTVSVNILNEIHVFNVTIKDTTPAPEPTYNVTVNISKNPIFIGEVTKATITIKNTNNISGNFNGGVASSPTEYCKLLINTQPMKSITIPSQTIGAGESYTTEYYIRGMTKGTGKLTVSGTQLSTQTKEITVNEDKPFTLNVFSSDNGFYVDNDSTMTATIESNDPNLNIVKREIILDSTHLKFNDDSSTYTDNNSVTGTSYSLSKTVKGITTGDSSITVKVTTSAGKTYTLTKTFTVGPKPTITGPEYSFNTLEVHEGDYITVTVKYTNTSENVGYTPKNTITLPNGLTAMEGGQNLNFGPVKIKSKSTATVSNLIVANTPGTYNLLLNNNTFKIKVNAIVTPTPIFGNNWAVLTKTELYAKDTAQLILNYRVTNNVYPATLPKTTITLPENVTFTDGSSSKTIEGKVLNEGESYNNENTDSIFIKFKKIGTGTINISNETLGTTLINVTTNPEPAQLNITFDDILVETTHAQGGTEIPVIIDFKNTGGVKGTFKNVILQLSGDVLEFEDGTQKITYSEITVNPEKFERKTIKIYTKGEGTGQLKITENTTNYTATKTIKINKPTTPEYDYSFSIEPPKIPLYTNKEQITSQLKITIKNTNNIPGTSPELYVQLDEDLSLGDGSKAYSITGHNIPAQGKYDYTLPVPIKGLKTGPKTVDVRIKGGDYIGNLILNILAPTIRSYGLLNLESCKFSNNEGMLGGAIYNTSNMIRKECIFENNTSTDKCNNIYNNGGCE